MKGVGGGGKLVNKIKMIFITQKSDNKVIFGLWSMKTKMELLVNNPTVLSRGLS